MASQPKSKWPDGRRAAISITMDNMGEAAEILRGTWPGGKAIGRHSSVTIALPRMLQILEELNVRATYFIEGWNTRYYPDAIQSVSRAGHEIAFHGWQHEPWSTLNPEMERDLFEKSLRGFEPLSLELRGFRPPGGVLTSMTTTLLREYGFAYCSPAGQDAAIDENTVYLPFDWQGIDAYYYSDAFSGLREAKGEPPAVLEPSELVTRMCAIVDERVESGGYTALLFHPFLEDERDRTDAMRKVLERVANDDRLWCAPGFEVAAWIRANRNHFMSDPGLDLTSWAR